MTLVSVLAILVEYTLFCSFTPGDYEDLAGLWLMGLATAQANISFMLQNWTVLKFKIFVGFERRHVFSDIRILKSIFDVNFVDKMKN